MPEPTRASPSAAQDPDQRDSEGAGFWPGHEDSFASLADEQPADAEPRPAASVPEPRPASGPAKPKPTAPPPVERSAAEPDEAPPPIPPSTESSPIEPDPVDIPLLGFGAPEPEDTSSRRDVVPGHPQRLPEDWAFGAKGRLPGVWGGRRRLFVLGSIALVIVLAAGAFVLTSSGSGSQALALSFSKGTTDHYRLTSSVQVTGNIPDAGAAADTEAHSTATLDWHVHKVGSDGIATVDLSMSKLDVSVDGKPVQVPARSRVTMTIAPDGRVLSAAGLDGSVIASGGQKSLGMLPSQGQQIAPVLPEGEVAVGDSWKRSFTQQLPGNLGSVDVKSTSRYIRDQSLHGVSTAVVQTNYEIPVDLSISEQGVDVHMKGAIQDAVTSWVDPGTKRLQQVVSDMTSDLSVDAGNGSSSVGFTLHVDGLTTLRRI